MSFGTTPDLAAPAAVGASTVTSTWRSIRAAPALELARGRAGRRACARRRAAPPRRTRGGGAGASYSAGRSGARPMPPATITTSPPAAASTGHVFPNGPRTPSTRAAAAPRRSRVVTAPTARTVWTSGPRGSPETEIGTSPTPKAYSIVNCPGAGAGRSPATGSSSSVHVSCVSRRRDRTRNGRGANGLAPASACCGRRHRRRGAGAASTAAARSAPARSATSGRSPSFGSCSHFPRRQAPSNAVARTASSARASKCQR